MACLSRKSGPADREDWLAGEEVKAPTGDDAKEGGKQRRKATSKHCGEALVLDRKGRVGLLMIC